MATLHNDKGIALITALLFTLISLGMIMALLSIVVQGTRVSAANKAYKNANEASYGAIDVVSRDILPAIFNGTFDDTYKQNLTDAIGLNLAFPLDACFVEKVDSSTTSWASCTAQSKTSLPKESPDMTFNLNATNDSVGFKVYAKIIDTRCGSDMAGQPCSNSDTTGVDYLEAGSGVTSATGSVTPQHLPAYYRIEVQSERAVSPNEKSQLSVLYAY